MKTFLSLFTLLACLIGTAGAQTPAPDLTPTPNPVQPITLPSLEQVIKSLPEDSFVQEVKPAVKALKSDDPQEAVKLIEALGVPTMHAFNPEQRYLVKGIAQLELKDPKQAISSLNQSLKYRASNSDALFFKTWAQLLDNQFSEAAQTILEATWFERAKLLSLDQVYVLQAIALSRGEKPQADEVVKILNTAIGKNPNSTMARASLSEIELRRGNQQPALKYLRDAIALQPNDNELKLNLAKTLLTNADRTLNRAEIDEARKITTDLVADKDLSQSEAAAIIPLHVKALLASGQAEDAEKALNAAMKKYPQETSLPALQKQIDLEKQAKAPLVPTVS